MNWYLEVSYLGKTFPSRKGPQTAVKGRTTSFFVFLERSS